MAIQNDTTYGYDNPGAHHSLRDLLTIVFKRRKIILVFAVTVFSLVMAVTLLMPRTYETTATLLVHKARADVPLAPSGSGQLIVNQVTEQDLNSEVEILKSRQLIEDVLRTLGVDESWQGGEAVFNRAVGWLKALVGGKNLNSFDATVVNLSRELHVSAIRRSNLIRISYKSKDPQWATDIVGTMTDRYLEQRVERYQSPQAVSFFEEQMADAELRLADRERALEDFVEEASITMVKGPQGSDVLAAQKALVMQNLARLENEYGDAVVESQEQMREVSSLRAKLAEEPERLQTASREHRNAAIEEIERRLAALKLERDALLQDFKPNSRRVSDIDAQIQLAEARLQEGREHRLGIDGTENSPVYLEIKSELLRAEAQLAGTRARISSLRQQVDHHRQILETLNDQTFELDRLNRDASTAEEDFLLYRRKYEEARISAAMDQEKFINVTVAQPAQLPLKPVSRGLVLKSFLALVIAIVGGVGLAFVLEIYLDRSFTTGEDVERSLGIPHIASIPEGEMVG
jgi:uncharacterized protein involved in exopolysaccharide biosynthesis